MYVCMATRAGLTEHDLKRDKGSLSVVSDNAARKGQQCFFISKSETNGRNENVTLF